ncbi:short-chain dehydrogenase [Chromatiales bacterium (ex Bugula neritina AB1)]|nr:short-chain dehydrogenase [Chromatiales bacterium (ex Bugula neritina AB1)]
MPTVDKLLDLTGKVAIVTGGSGGIGKAIALRLAEAGARVAVHYHTNEASALSVVNEIGSRDAIAVRADLREEKGCVALLDQTEKVLGQQSILVNNAGIQPISPLLQMAGKELDDMLQSNITAPVILTRLFAERYGAGNSQGRAAITNIASIEGLQPAAGHSHYASSKAALIMFTRAAAQELGPHGIRVNCVSPGLIDRPGLEQDWPEGVNRYRSAAPLGSTGGPRDIADAVLFLSSSAARWISGSNLVVDGGVSCAPTW